MMVIKIQSRDVYSIMRGTHPDWSEGLDSNLTHWAYNALDSAVTLSVHAALQPKLAASPHAALSYRFVRAMQGPALAMMSRGIMVNQKVRQDETVRYTKIRAEAQALLDTLADAIWGPEEYTEKVKTREMYTPLGKSRKPLTPRFRTVISESSHVRPRGLNPNSNIQVLAFFNTALRCEVHHEIRKLPTGTIRTPTANGKALRKWAAWKTKGPGVDPRDRSIPAVQFAQPFISLILTIRDADKMLSVLRSPLDSDGRMRCSYNVVGTENGRWSSSENAFGRGTNLQNITPTMRRMFCSDDGWRFISTDLEQAESRLVAGLVWQTTGSRAYWDACLSSDLHTTVARMSWPELDWTDDHKHNRAVADRSYPGLAGRFSYRDVAKRIGHGCVTPDHEVLTPKGWVHVNENPQTIMGIDSDGQCIWQDVARWNTHRYTGPMYYFKGTSVDQLVTPNHRMIFSRDPRGSGKLTELPAEEWTSKGAIPLGHGYSGPTWISPWAARMVAAVQADGEIRGQKVRFHFHKQRKFDRIKYLCTHLGVNWTVNGNHITVDWTMNYPKQANVWLLSWSSEALQAYSDEHRHWDGHISKTAISIASKDRTHLEWLQTINRLRGKGGNIQKPQVSGFGTIMFSLQENNRKWADRDSMSRTVVEYDGYVHCPTVSTGMFLVRRNGRISATGNSNYRGSPFGIAAAVGIPANVVEEFQKRYFKAFPAIPEWHKYIAATIADCQYLDTPLGRRRWFFGRPAEDSTIREAIAYIPQSTIGELLNLAMLRTWERSRLPITDPNHLPIQLLLQNHDAFAFQIPESANLPHILAEVKSLLEIPIPLVRADQVEYMTIPAEFVTGWNWAYKDKGADPAKWNFADGNPDGLTKWGGSDPRKRTQSAATSPGDWLSRSVI